ncbi:MAG: acyl-CoA desaturase [Ktedonobacteraceae bacterium]
MIDGSASPSSPTTHFSSGYAELKQRVKEAGLLEKQPIYYAGKIGLLLVLLTISIVVLLFVKPFWVQVLNAVYLSFVTTQLGLLGHDAGHRQIFHRTWKNDMISLCTGNLCIGISHEWWMGRHNKHHSHPNQLDLDPDVNIPIIAFSSDDLAQKATFLHGFLKYQAYFFFPVLTLALIDMQKNSIAFLLQERGKYYVTERLLLVLHFVGYFALLFSHLSIWQALLFILIHSIVSGVFMGSIFAPNHKGMPVLDADSQLDFLHRQVLTARNVYAHPLTDFWYGGLNYQIEHHLFPSMPRNQLRKAQGMIKAFCLAQAIPYYETHLVQSYRETLSALHAVTAPLREAGKLSSHRDG